MSAWEKNVRRVLPYVPGEQPKEEGVIKLNTNENPYPPSPKVRAVLRDFDVSQLRRYPDPEAADLRAAVAKRNGIDPSCVFVGVGSDDVLAMAFLTFFNGGDPVLFPDITYSFYDVWAGLFSIPFETQPLREDFSVDPADYKKKNDGIVLPNPNAPTGLEAPSGLLEEIVRSNPDSVVIIDEAYVDFGAKSALPLIRAYDNLLVVQTFSKSRSLAGSRIGLAFGDPKLIACLNDCKFSFNSYTMDRLSLEIARAAIEDEAYFQETVQKIVATRERTKARLKEVGFSFPDSQGNFIFASHERLPARLLFERLKEKKIYVRYFDRPRIDGHLRITIGTDEEMESFCKAVSAILSQEGCNY